MIAASCHSCCLARSDCSCCRRVRSGIVPVLFFTLLVELRVFTSLPASLSPERLLGRSLRVGNKYVHSAPRDISGLLNASACLPRRLDKPLARPVTTINLSAELDATAELITRLVARDILAVLAAGTMLGSERHFERIPWDTKDFDLAVFSTDVDAIQASLRETSGISEWHHNRDGQDFFVAFIGQYIVQLVGGHRMKRAFLKWWAGKASPGFGLHVDFPGRHTYLDLWLHASVDHEHVSCVGVDGGCYRW